MSKSYQVRGLVRMRGQEPTEAQEFALHFSDCADHKVARVKAQDFLRASYPRPVYIWRIVSLYRADDVRLTNGTRETNSSHGEA